MDVLVILDAHFDLLQRRLRAKSNVWKQELSKRATFLKELREKGERTTSREKDANGDRVDRELNKFRVKVRPVRARARAMADLAAQVQQRIKRLSDRWNEAKVVSLREKVSFLTGACSARAGRAARADAGVTGVMNVLCSALMLGFVPEWMWASHCANTASI